MQRKHPRRGFRKSLPRTVEARRFGTSLLISQLQGFLHQLDFSEITGYADLVRRNQGRNLPGKAALPANNLLKAADRVVTDMIALRTAMDKFRDSQAIVGRLNQVSQEFSFSSCPKTSPTCPMVRADSTRQSRGLCCRAHHQLAAGISSVWPSGYKMDGSANPFTGCGS